MPLGCAAARLRDALRLDSRGIIDESREELSVTRQQAERRSEEGGSGILAVQMFGFV